MKEVLKVADGFADAHGMPTFSVLTSVYERTPANYFAEAWESLRQQDYPGLQWVVLAHGPISEDVTEVLRKIEQDSFAKVLWLAENRGIVGGVRYCLEQADGEYVIALDADDLLPPGTLRTLARYVLRHQRPSMLYSDEDHYVNGQSASPFIRPDWDPVLALSASYIWHVCAMRRDRALELGVYNDPGAEWCHDWDSVLRFFQAGDRIVHVPEILYHWRTHEASSTNRPDPESGSLKSQRYVLNRFIHEKLDPELFEVREFPMFRGAVEYWLCRLRKRPTPMTLIIYGSHPTKSVAAACSLLRNADYSFENLEFVDVDLTPGERIRVSDLARCSQSRVRCWPDARPRDLDRILADSAAQSVTVCSERVHVEGDTWPWECDGLFRSHADVAIVAGRVLDKDSTLLAGSEILGFEGISGCPDRGRRADDAGYFAMALKPRSVSAPYSELFTARAHILREFASSMQEASWTSIGCWLGAIAIERGQRVAVTPLFNGVLQCTGSRTHMGSEEAKDFTQRFGSFLPDTRWYSARFGWRRDTAYSLQPAT